MSRTRRVGPREGFWATVDSWAADVVEPSAARAWWTSRARLEAGSGPYLDVTGELPPGVGARPLRTAVAATGVAFPDDPAVRARLEATGTGYRRVEAARRYRWNGPALTPVLLELHVADEDAVVEAWWEDVWIAWPTIRLGRESEARRPPRRAVAISQVARLLDALGHEPLTPPDRR